MKKVMVVSGAGLSAESGLRTFRDEEGLWAEHDVMKVCSVQGWQTDREFVTSFYDARRMELAEVEPNRAHRMFTELEDYPSDPECRRSAGTGRMPRCHTPSWNTA